MECQDFNEDGIKCVKDESVNDLIIVNKDENRVNQVPHLSIQQIFQNEIDETIQSANELTSNNNLANLMDCQDNILNGKESCKVNDLAFFLQEINDFDRNNESESELSDSSSSADNDMLNEKQQKSLKFKNAIIKLCIDYIHTIPHIAIDDLLKILNENTDISFPKNATTLLKTPRKTEIHSMETGQYCHYGLKRAISIFLSKIVHKGINIDYIELLVNIDGAPLAKFSEKGIWIISCSETILKDVELIGIYHGEDKPVDSNNLLKMFVEEITFFINNGLKYNGKNYIIKLHALVCDTPAKAYILKVKYHTGYSSCTKCKIEGEYLCNRVCFPESTSNLRTDFEFKEYCYVDDGYQNERTILCDIPNFKPVTNIVLDYMHLISLGVTLQLIKLWLDGPTTCKISEQQRELISDKLVN